MQPGQIQDIAKARIHPIRKDVVGDDATMATASPFAHITGHHPSWARLEGGLEQDPTGVHGIHAGIYPITLRFRKIVSGQPREIPLSCG